MVALLLQDQCFDLAKEIFGSFFTLERIVADTDFDNFPELPDFERSISQGFIQDHRLAIILASLGFSCSLLFCICLAFRLKTKGRARLNSPVQLFPISPRPSPASSRASPQASPPATNRSINPFSSMEDVVVVEREPSFRSVRAESEDVEGRAVEEEGLQFSMAGSLPPPSPLPSLPPSPPPSPRPDPSNEEGETAPLTTDL